MGIKRFFRKSNILILILFFLLALSSCSKDDNLNPTDAFYINDYANVLLRSTKNTIYRYSKYVYDQSSEISDYVEMGVDGTQVVVITYSNEPALIDTTEIFNRWGIGKNDLGILIILYFEEITNELVYKNLSFEIGIKMSEYLTAYDASNLIDGYFNSDIIPEYDIDERLIALYFAVMENIYQNIYEYTARTGNEYPYNDLYDDYLAIKYEDTRPLPGENKSIFSLIPLWVWIGIIVLILYLGVRLNLFNLILSILLGRSTGKESGGSGRSRGYWFRK